MDSNKNKLKRNPDNSDDWKLQPYKKHKYRAEKDSAAYSDVQIIYDTHRAICPEIVTLDDDEDVFDFDQLPTELIHKILGYLTPEELCQYVAPVCKKWKDFAHNPVLWKCVYLHGEKRSTRNSMRILGRCYGYLKSLTMCRFSKLTEFSSQLSICGVLKILRLAACEGVNATFVASLTASAPLVQEVSFEASDISDAAALQIPKWKKLHTVNLSSTRLTEESIIQVVKECTKLKSINVEIIGLSDDVVKVITEERKGTLRKLYLEGAALSDVSCKTLERCEELDSLTILNGKQLTDITLNAIKLLSKLKYLRLTHGLLFYSKGLSSLFNETRSTELIFLDLSECFGVNDAVVQAMIRCSSKLESLRLDYCFFLTESAIQTIVRTCRCLKVLSLVNVKLVKGYALKDISKNLPYLTSLNLQLCDCVDEKSICELLRQKKDLSIIDPRGRKAVPGVLPARWITTAGVNIYKEYSLTVSCLENWTSYRTEMSSNIVFL